MYGIYTEKLYAYDTIPWKNPVSRNKESHYYAHGFSSVFLPREALKPDSEVLCSCEDSMDEIRFKVDGINITCNNNQCTVLKIDLAAPN
jgi:hypothetical protein